MTVPEIIGIVTDVAVAGAAITTVCIALHGLHSWREQKKADLELVLMQRLTDAWIKLQDAVRDANYKTEGIIGAHKMGVTREFSRGLITEVADQFDQAINDFSSAALAAEILGKPNVERDLAEVCGRYREGRRNTKTAAAKLQFDFIEPIKFEEQLGKDKILFTEWVRKNFTTNFNQQVSGSNGGKK